MDEGRFKRILEREKAARKEAERLLESKSTELYEVNQRLEEMVAERTQKLSDALDTAENAIKVKDQFLSNMSHEIRTPLNAIMGFVQLMLNSEYDKKSFIKHLNIINNSSQDLLQIINDILDFSKMQSGKFTITPEKTNLKEKIEQTKALFFKEAEAKSLKYTLQFSENFPQYVIVDETRIAQIVSNFISNAIKFTPENKSVNIDVTYDTVTQKLKVLVEDTGIGIDEKAQAKIFNSFEQEDASVTRKYGGTGLGLAISKQLVSLMQGELIFKSIKDVGSTFGFEIPAEVGKEDDANKEESSVPEVEYTGKVLIAEDNAMNTILMETFMEAFGIAFDIVENGALAVEAVKEEEYALVLMDNQMPVLSGIEATMQIRAFNTTLPIVALSANAIKTEQEKFLEVGMNDTLAKPVDYYDLKAIFDKYLG